MTLEFSRRGFLFRAAAVAALPLLPKFAEAGERTEAPGVLSEIYEGASYAFQLQEVEFRYDENRGHVIMRCLHGRARFIRHGFRDVILEPGEFQKFQLTTPWMRWEDADEIVTASFPRFTP